jgi:hypothetical protein
MAWARLVCNQMKEFLLEKLVEDGASQQAKRQVTKRCDIITKCLLLLDGFLSVSWTEHKDLALELMAKARDHATKALAVWQTLKLSVTPKSNGSECHACNQLELPQGLADFCEDFGGTASSAEIEEQLENKGGQGQRPKTGTVRQMGAVKQESK